MNIICPLVYPISFVSRVEKISWFYDWFIPRLFGQGWARCHLLYNWDKKRKPLLVLARAQWRMLRLDATEKVNWNMAASIRKRPRRLYVFITRVSYFNFRIAVDWLLFSKSQSEEETKKRGIKEIKSKKKKEGSQQNVYTDGRCCGMMDASRGAVTTVSCALLVYQVYAW